MYAPRDLYLRSLSLHRLVAEKVRSDPARFEEARGVLARWRTIVSGDSQPYLEEWAAAFSEGLERALEVALEDSEHGDTLRHCSPLACVLTNKERWAFHRQWSERHATAGP